MDFTFSPVWWRAQETAENRRFSQKTAGNRRLGSVTSLTVIFWVRKKGSFGKGVFSEKSISRDSRELRDSRDSGEPPDSGKQRRLRPLTREFRDFRDSRDSSSEKTPFAMTSFSVPDL